MKMAVQSSFVFDRMRYFAKVLEKRPDALARVKGSTEYPSIRGEVRFYQTKFGVLVFAQIYGLPEKGENCKRSVFGFHIHKGMACTGSPGDPFADTLTHYNPGNCDHPSHAGDLPPLFGNGGYAVTAFLTDRFSADEITGRTVVIHASQDDFTTQPAGNAGAKIACGKIVKG